MSLDIEPFDEWEEFALFGCHYFLLIADNCKALSSLAPSETQDKIQTPGSQHLGIIQMSMEFTESIKGQGPRRFGAALFYRDSKATADGACNFGGMGSISRMSTCDGYSSRIDAQLPQINSNIGYPSARMCHTVTDLGETGALLVGKPLISYEV
jgi:tRNA wybutosine-synthesizing protein 4